MSARESRKDELAARALSRLADPPLPEGLAARITARAIATPQVGTAISGAPSPAPNHPEHLPARAHPAPPARPQRKAPDRRRLYAGAAIAAALLLLVGGVVGLPGDPDPAPVVAGRDEPLSVPLTETAAPPRMADAAPVQATPTTAPHKKAAKTRAPIMVLPVPATAPVELAADDLPAATPTPGPAIDEKEQLAQTGPQDAPTGGALRPVYGPPAPVGLGIAGAPGGRGSLPGDSGTTSRSPDSGGTAAPPGGPPPGMPGPGGGPRGPGPRL